MSLKRNWKRSMLSGTRWGESAGQFAVLVLGKTSSQARPPHAHNAAATRKDAVQPNFVAMAGVRDAVRAPPNWPPMFIKPDTDPAALFPISALSDQNELCDRYNAPAPPARKNVASCALSTVVPNPTKAAASNMAMDAKTHRPARRPTFRETMSLIQPPSAEPTAIAMNGSME